MDEDKKQDENLIQGEGELGEVEKLKQERDEYLNGWKRAKADLINYQKDEGKRFEEMMKYATEAMIRDLIPVLDSLELAVLATSPVRGSEGSQLASASNGIDQRGLYLIKTQLEEVLKKKGLEKIKVSPGDPFDTMKHESIGEVDPPAGGKGISGQIAEEIESGYMLNGKVVRPARVKLSK